MYRHFVSKIAFSFLLKVKIAHFECLIKDFRDLTFLRFNDPTFLRTTTFKKVSKKTKYDKNTEGSYDVGLRISDVGDI